MPVQATKHPSQFTIGLGNIMGGLCLIANPEAIPDGFVAQMDNWEYGTLLNQPQVCPGVATQYDLGSDVDTLFYDAVHDVWHCSSGTNEYQVPSDFTTHSLMGSLTGTYTPIYALYDDVVLLASGGQIQKISSGTTLETVPSSPMSHWVAHNNGRVEAFNILSDVKNYSAIGDYNGWTNDPAVVSSSQFVDVGYKDFSQIACTIKLATDSIVIKTSGVAYRVLNENDFANISVVPAAQKSGSFNQYSGLSLANKAYYIGPEGFNSFSTVTDYGGVKVDDPSPGSNINGWYVQNVDSGSKIWHVPSRKQVWAKTSNMNEVLIYHYGINAWSKRQFKYPVHDVVCKGMDIYIAYGTKIGKLDDKISTDDGFNYTAIIASKRYLPKYKKFLMKYLWLITYNFIEGNYILEVGGKILPVLFSSTADIANIDYDIADTDSDPVNQSNYTPTRKRMRKRATAVQMVLTVQSGRLAIRDMGIDLVQIGR